MGYHGNVRIMIIKSTISKHDATLINDIPHSHAKDISSFYLFDTSFIVHVNFSVFSIMLCNIAHSFYGIYFVKFCQET